MLSGGKMIDEGMYSCIFNSALSCKKNTTKTITSSELNKDTEDHTEMISKLIHKEWAEQEFDISQQLAMIPLWRNYFVVSESICEPTIKQKEKDISKCGPLQMEDLSDFRVLRMPYRGTSMHLYRFDLKRFQFMDFAKHLIEAGALLNLFGIVHRDLHQGNLLIDENDVPRIIDFNLSLHLKNKITESDLSHKYEYTIAQEPPDSTLVNAISRNYPYDNVIHSISFKKPILKKITTLLGVSQQEMYNDLNHFYTISNSVKTGNNVKWFNTYWRVVDSWAIGINLVDLILKLLMWSEFRPVLQENKSKLFPMLKRMCAVSPVDRIDCVQALYYLDPTHFIIRKYGKQWIEKVGDGKIK